jgi:hypothetical protein
MVLAPFGFPSKISLALRQLPLSVGQVVLVSVKNEASTSQMHRAINDHAKVTMFDS